MQVVLWFAGLRGAIAFALAENMPGENREVYVTGTLTICIITTVFCGGFTERLLTLMDMKERKSIVVKASDDMEDNEGENLVLSPMRGEDDAMIFVNEGVKNWFSKIDENYLMVYFGGEKQIANISSLGNYELSDMNGSYDENLDEPF